VPSKTSSLYPLLSFLIDLNIAKLYRVLFNISIPVNLQTFEKFVKASALGVFNPETHEGYWRQLMVRLSTGSDQLMLVVGIHPQTLSQEELRKVKDDLKDFFENGEGKICNVASLYFQHIMRRWDMKLDLLLNTKLVHLCVVV
jgi:hypothetical protein